MKGHSWRVYINPFNDQGQYTGFVEVTDDVELDSLGTIDQNLDNTDYNIGIYRNANFAITFRNDSGKYSDVGQANSMFRYKRSNSLVKITWTGATGPLICGFFQAGNAVLASEIEMFTGLLDDSTVTMDMQSQELQFNVMGRETILNRGVVPFSALTIGMNLSDAIKACLNQTFITSILTYSAANVNVGIDVPLDSIADLQNKTVWAAMQDLLLISNSVLYVQSGNIIVAPRTVGASLAYTFYGQSSVNGPENIQDIQNISSGFPRLFNYLYWSPSNVTVQNASSVSKFGAQQKKFSQTYITNTTNQASLLQALINEFGVPKQEMDIYTPLNYQTQALFLLDKVNIDFPPMLLQGADPWPICGTAICGQAVLPDGIWSFMEVPQNSYKVIGTSVDPQTDLVCITVRKV